MNAAPSLAVWVEVLAVLTLGATAIVGLAALTARLMQRALWERTVWQISTLALAALTLCELTGVGHGIARWAVSKTSSRSVPPLGAKAASESRPASVGRSTSTEARAQDLLDQAVAALTIPDFPEDSMRKSTVVPSMKDPSGLTEPRDRGFVSPLGASLRSARGTQLASRPEQSPEVLPSAGRGCWWPGMIWLVGAALVACRPLFARLLLVGLRWRRLAPDEALQERVQILARRLGMRRRVCVATSPGLSGPIAFGLLRPTIGLPLRFSDDYDPAERDAMLSHELGHLAGRDPAWHLLADLVTAALWWHPLAWWSRQQLRAANEWAADESSLLVPDGPELLAGCLVQLAGRLVGASPPEWARIEGSGVRSSLGRRVERLLGFGRRPWQPPRRVRLYLVKIFAPAALVAAAILCTAWARPVSFQIGEPAMRTMRNSWERSVVRVAVVAALGTSFNAVLADTDRSNSASKAAIQLQRTSDKTAQDSRTEEPKLRNGTVIRAAELRDEAVALEQKLDTGDQEGATDKASEDLSARARLKKLPEHVLKVQQELLVAKENLRRAQEQLGYAERMHKKGYVTRLQLQALKRVVLNDQIAAKIAEDKLGVLEELKAYQALLDEYQRLAAEHKALQGDGVKEKTKQKEIETEMAQLKQLLKAVEHRLTAERETIIKRAQATAAGEARVEQGKSTPQRSAGDGLRSTLRIKVFQLQHRDPKELSQLLHTLGDLCDASAVHGYEPMNYRGTIWIAADTRTRSLVVRGPEEVLRFVGDLVAALDLPPDKPAPQMPNLRIFKLRFADAKKIIEVLRDLGFGARILQDPSRNTLIVRGPAAEHEEIAKLIEALDVQSPLDPIEGGAKTPVRPRR